MKKVHYKKVLGKKCFKKIIIKNSVIKKITDPNPDYRGVSTS